MNLSKLSNSQLHRLMVRVHARIYRLFAGGTQFGVDMPTLWAVAPGWAEVVQAIRRETGRRVVAGTWN